jgi:GTPase
MMTARLPIVSIVGRQNVGKSTLFNALIRERRAIVDAHPGLTRDIITFTMKHGDVSFIVSDTPGLNISASSELSQAIIETAHRQLERSSLIVLLMEKPGPEAFDYELMEFLRKFEVPIVVAVNKMDNVEDFINLPHFYEMGLGEIIPISALRRRNIPLLLDKISSYLPQKQHTNDEPDVKIAIVGRPNSGKSTLLNSLMGYERAVVSEIPGTTRDSIDDDFMFHEKRIRITDTAGLRRKSKVDEDIEFYSMTRTIESIRKSDVVIHMIDATLGLTENDKKISDEILDAGKCVIIAINKWDAIEKDTGTFNEYRDKIIFKYYRAGDFPIISISAREKQRVHRLVQTALDLNERAGKQVQTHEFNKVLEDLQRQRRNPQLVSGLKIFYGTQTGTKPPRFKLFVNKPELFKKDLVRYLEKSLQAALELREIPLVLEIEGRSAEKTKKARKSKKPQKSKKK